MIIPAERCGPAVGCTAPAFELACTSGKKQSRRVARLGDYRGKWLILIFYPRDFSLVCPTELSAMSDRYEELARLGAEVLAVSTDPLETHEAWLETPSSLGGLGAVRFPLASDLEGRVSRAYCVYMEAQRVALRGLFVIDPNSVLQYALIHNLSVGRRSEEIVRVLTALQTGGLCPENWTPGREVLAVDQLRPGTAVSHYRVERKLGEGGFATVYLAYDRILNRHVALKLLKRPDGCAPHLLREARAAAALNHPNVCTIFGVDDSEGIALIVMEYLRGRPLSKVVSESPLPAATARGVALQVAAALRAAHDCGIVHGDLKPANIFLLVGDQVVKILDFGVGARLRPASSGGVTASLESAGEHTISGTPGYMSPEQADGEPATPASDAFSLGLTLYELLTGRRAIHGDNVLQLLRAVRSVDPDTLAADVDEPFRSLVRRLLVREPEQRATMREVERALQHSQQTAPAPAVSRNVCSLEPAAAERHR